MFNEILQHIWQVWVDTALWLCFGLLFAAVAHIYLRTEHLQKWLAKPGLGSVIRAALLGAPLPLCSCGVLPAAIGLRRAGASREASVAFLISTPETGVDSVAVSYALLGPFYAILRPVAALLTAFSAGFAVWRWGGQESSPSAENEQAGCCGANESSRATESHGDHDHDAPTGEEEVTLAAGLAYAFGKLLDDLAGWLVFGVVLAGVILALVPPELLAEYGQSPWALILMLLVGVPLYVCAVASTPIAAALLVAGVSPGAVLVFLLAGPATNLGGLILIAKEFGQRVAGIYLITISAMALILGFIVNSLIPAGWIGVAVSSAGHQSGNLIHVFVAFLLAAWLAWRLIIRRLGR